MNAKKRRAKDKRRARKLANEAWDAADDDNLQLGLKIIGRAVELDIGNPLIWHDQGQLRWQAGDHEGAAEAYLAVISLAPTFAEAYANLAEIRFRQNRISEAVSLQVEATRLAPQSAQYQAQLSTYRAVAGQQPASIISADQIGHADPKEAQDLVTAHRRQFVELAVRIDNFDDDALQTELSRRGYVTISKLLTPGQCQYLREMFQADAPFAKTVVMDKSRFGQGVYRYFSSPIPSLIDAIRRLTYSSAAKVANHWQHLLGDAQRFPDDWEAFRKICSQAGQVTPSPLMLRYESGGFNAPHCDIRGDVFFPLQLVIVLSPQKTAAVDDEGFEGGEFLFCDTPQRKSTDGHSIAAGLGDAVLFCTRSRLVKVAGIFGWQSVQHGAAEVISGTRYVLGIPYHEFT